MVEEWRNVFYVAAGIYLVGALLYWLMVSAKVQPWAIEKEILPEDPTSKLDNTTGKIVTEL